MNKRYWLVLTVLLLAALACSSPADLAPTQTPYPTYTAYPTLTPFPSPTATPEPETLMENDFASDKCLNLDSNSDVKRFMEADSLRIQVVSSQLLGWVTCDKQDLTDFILEVDATQVGGPDNNEYGVVFRYNNNTGEFYSFEISGDGYYFMRYNGISSDKSYMLVNWSDFSGIKKGAQTNHLKISAIGSSFEVYVNGALAVYTHNSALKSGRIGFLAGSFQEGNVHASFDNLKITKP